jgi:CHAD domain-containing protein
VTIERETKLDVGPDFRLPGFDDVGPDLQIVRAEPVRTHTTYWDTGDLRLARWGCSLRHREGQGWTLKLPARRDGDAMERDEIVELGPADTPPSRLVDLVTAFLRGEPLRPTVTLSTVRTRVAFTRADRATVGEVVDDEVAVLDGPRSGARFREVEVETHDEALAGAAIARLRAAGARETVLTPKYLRALGPRADGPRELRTARSLPPDAGLRDLVANALSASVIRLISADAAVRLDDDPEAVHAARVAVRRMRSDLRTFGSMMDPTWSAALRSELAWLGDALRDVRDLDVLLARLATRVEDLGPDDRDAGQLLLTRGGLERSAARARLLADLRSTRYRALLARLVDAAIDPRVLPDAETSSAAEATRRVLDRPWAKLRRACGRLSAASSDRRLHAARIHAKRVRYAAEALAPVAGGRIRRLARSVGELQEALGAHQDAVVATAWLRDAAREVPDAAFVAGIWAAREDRERRRARRRWPRAWTSARRRWRDARS